MEPKLALFDTARAALTKAHTVDEVKRIRDQAEALRAYVKQARGSREMANQCAELKLRAERKLGQLLDRSLPHDGGRPKKPSHDATVSSPTLDNLGINRSQSSRWQQIAGIPKRTFEGYVDAVQQSPDEELTTAGLLRASDRQNTVDIMGSSETYEWFTPAPYVDAARAVMGGIDLDPASSPIANKTVRAKRFFTLEEGGLSKNWRGRVFLNPPYGRAPAGGSNQGIWSGELIDRFKRGGLEQAMLLVNAATDATWFEKLWSFPICFVNHRIQFEGPEGKGPQPTHGNVFVYLGRRKRRFVQTFSTFGRIVVPHGVVSEVLG